MTRTITARLATALAGAVGSAAVLAALDAIGIAKADGAHITPLFAAELGLLIPVACTIGFAVGLAHLLLEPKGPLSPTEHLRELRSEPMLSRSRTAALVPLGLVGTLLFLLVTAHVGKVRLASGAPREAGLVLGLATLATFIVIAAGVLALTSPLRRVLASRASEQPGLVDPVWTGGFAFIAVTITFVLGMRAGDTGGEGGGPLGILGVLRRSELDLRPVLHATAIVAGAYAWPIFLRHRRDVLFIGGTVALLAAAFFLSAHEASATNREPNVILAIERRAPLGRVALRALRHFLDRDHDGASPYFAGGDCDDRDPARQPMFPDVPGNGVDEDCSGADAILPPPLPPIVHTPSAHKPPPDLDVILITIDTLRADIGFAGYPKPITPNVDALAKKGAIFDHAYALASYTGKSLAPMLIGKYGSETERDGNHFTKYGPTNTLVAERAQAAGIHTFGAASHWYFLAWSGLSQGMDTWDMSARPEEGQGDNDVSVTSQQLSDAAIRLLGDSANTGKRFFAWFHYFDPHAQYMPHDGAPNFLDEGQSSYGAITRAQYDGEVWYTDREVGRVLDFIAAQPWASHTAIIVTSDHGEAFGDHGMSWHAAELWEVLVHVPFVVYVPNASPHHVSERRSQIDLVPTILDLLSIPLPAEGELSGQSLLDDVMESGPFPSRDVFLDMPVGPYTAMRKALITGPEPGEKLIWLGWKTYQLFDLSIDPAEEHDLAGDTARLDPLVSKFETARARQKEIYVPAGEP